LHGNGPTPPGGVFPHPHKEDPKAFLFPTATGTAYRVGNFLKRVLKPIAKTAGIADFDFRAMRSTASTLFQAHSTVKETQGQMRHADPTTTLRYYVKVIPENGCISPELRFSEKAVILIFILRRIMP